MQNELFNALDGKIEQMLEEMELLRMEVSELREDKARLEAEQQNSEQKLRGLLSRFDALDA